MTKKEREEKLKSMIDKEITLINPIIHSCSSIRPFGGCKGTLLKYSIGESWEDIIVFAKMKNIFDSEEEVWLNAKDIIGLEEIGGSYFE